MVAVAAPALLREATGKDLAPQVMVKERPDPNAVLSLTWDDAPIGKAKGGVWTSSLVVAADDTRESDWIRWCRSELPEWIDRPWWVLHPNPDARLVVIDGYDDLVRVVSAHRHVPEWVQQNPWIDNDYYATIDFLALAHDGYDGVWLTERGNAECHLSRPFDLNTWDCECVFWFRWAFVGEPVKISEGEPCPE